MIHLGVRPRFRDPPAAAFQVCSIPGFTAFDVVKAPRETSERGCARVKLSSMLRPIACS
jgi:hypothetical protein